MWRPNGRSTLAGEGRPRARLTVVAAIVSGLLTLPYLMVAIDLGTIVYGGRELDAHSAREIASLGITGQEVINLLMLAFFVLMFIAGYVLVLSLGIYHRRQWARHGAILSYVFFAMVMLPLAIGGFTADPPAANAWLGIVLGLADLVVPALLLTEPVSDDFGDEEWYREREHHRPLPPDPHMVASRH